MDRRDFLKLGGHAGLALLLTPAFGREIAESQLLDRLDIGVKKRLADAALSAAKAAGATYCDVRVGKYLRQFVLTRENKVRDITSTESTGVGIRVIVRGTWGFAATSDLGVDAVVKATRQAVEIARANSRLTVEPVRLAPVKGVGEVSWATPIERNAMAVPIKDKADLLLAANAAALAAGASFVNSSLFQINEQKYFASSDGSYIDQDIHRIWAPFTANATDKSTGKFRSRDGLSAPVGRGYEYLEPKPEHRFELPCGAVVWSDSYDLIEDAKLAGRQAREKLSAPSVKPGKYDLVIDPTNLFLTIHESVGHPLELDRVLGYEANYAGTSFATLDKRDAKFQFGSDIVTLYAERTQPGSLGRVGYDDEGVAAKRWNLVDKGVLVNYQATRDQVHLIGEKASQGCSYADSWSSVQFQRMPNVSLAPGAGKLGPADMVKDVANGIYILGRGSYSIDQQRYNAQFGGQLFYEIKDGKVTGMIEDVAYQIRTPEFWNACSAICDRRDFRMNGSFFDGKGQPSQVSAVSHGAATARFDGINVINTARNVG